MLSPKLLLRKANSFIDFYSDAPGNFYTNRLTEMSGDADTNYLDVIKTM